MSFDWIQIRLHLAVAFVEISFAVVDMEKKMINRSSGKSRGIYSQLKVQME